jgi:ATP synthase protein I
MSADSGEQQHAGPDVESKTNYKTTLGKPPLTKIFTAQIVLLVLASAGLLLVDRIIAWSALLGGLIAIAPNIYFARWAFRFSGARAAQQVAHSFYIGEAGKFVITVCLFALVFATITPLSVVSIFVTYLVMVIVNWFFAAHLSKYRGGHKVKS